MATRTIAINPGHYLGNPKGVPKTMPVLGGTLEWTLNCRVADALYKMLADYDVKIIKNYDISGKTETALSTKVKTAETAKADFYLAIHHNGGINGGTGGGTVIYCKNNSIAKANAQKLLTNITSRTGLKGNRSQPINTKEALYEVRTPKMDAVLIECAFMDSVVDITYINKPEWATQVADGICRFLVDTLKLTKKTTVAADVSYKVSVNVSDLPIRDSAPGKVTGHITDKGTYTITEEKNGWGKLKSGAGWIDLSNTKKL